MTKRTIDIHKFKKEEAKKYIYEQINEVYKEGGGTLEVVHGFNNGTVLQDWIRNSKELSNYKYVKDVTYTTSGRTLIAVIIV